MSTCLSPTVVEWYEQVKIIRKQWKSPGNKADCEKLLNCVFTKIGRYRTVGWCSYDEQIRNNVSGKIMEWKRDKTNQTTQEEEVQWDSIWSMSIFS